jgi:hypothetical protein
VLQYFKKRRLKMAETKEVQKVPKKFSLRTILIGVAVFMLLALVLLTATGSFASPKTDPLGQFVTQKSCSFLVMGDISKEVCTDGTVYDVKQIGEAATPLP